MIRVNLIREYKNRGTFDYSMEGFVYERSRQPLLDACRQIKRMGDDTLRGKIGLYRKGRDKPDLTCDLDWGAAHTVEENSLLVRKWRPFQGLENG